MKWTVFPGPWSEKAQTAFNRGLYWSFGFKNKTSNTSIYNMSKELSIPPIASFCAKAMIRCFKKWKDSSCIISHLPNDGTEAVWFLRGFSN